MKANIEVDLKPFTVPNFVLPVKEGAKLITTTGVKLSSIDAVTLEKMCDEFKEAIFKKAGKAIPPTCRI